MRPFTGRHRSLCLSDRPLSARASTGQGQVLLDHQVWDLLDSQSPGKSRTLTPTTDSKIFSSRTLSRCREQPQNSRWVPSAPPGWAGGEDTEEEGQEAGVRPQDTLRVQVHTLETEASVERPSAEAVVRRRAGEQAWSPSAPPLRSIQTG